MLSKGLIKLINSLKHKKYRQQHGLFIAEGQKMISDLIKIDTYIKTIISAKFEKFADGIEFIHCKSSDLEKISSLKSSPDVIALVKIPNYQYDKKNIEDKLSLALDGVQDPGNMGTIIRLANWFGIENILCSFDSSDIYNPKVVQASMGALMKVKVHYLDLGTELIQLLKTQKYQIYGTFMDAESIYESELANRGLIVLGSEGRGISSEIEKLVTNRMTIPSFAKGFSGAESLNVGVAAGIIVSEFARQNDKKLEPRKIQ